MDIWQCSECSALMVGTTQDSKDWWFNGYCFQHNCKAIKKTMKEQGYDKDNYYRYASEKVSGGYVLDLIEQLQAENEKLKAALEEMCFCKKHTCKRCVYVKEMPERCINEQIRDKVFREQALNQNNDKSNDSSTGHTQSGEAE